VKKHITQYIHSHRPKNGRFFTIAIDGRGGSGKSSLADHLQKLLPNFVFINGDGYFEPIEDKMIWGAFNDQRFINDVIKPLKQDNKFMYRPYDWHAEPHITAKEVTVQSGFCLERCYSFTFNLDWDLKIWVETPKEVCLKRGMAREMMPREQVDYVWQNVWQPQEDEYIEKYKPQLLADFVIDGTKDFEGQLD